MERTAAFYVTWYRSLTNARMFEASFGRLELVEKINISLPDLALEVWPNEIIHERFALIGDSLRNVAALQEVQMSAVLRNALPERIEIASDVVWNHGAFIRRLPPPITAEDEPQDDRSEELGARLESRLHEIDPRLAQLRREAWKNLANGEAGARLAAHGIRDILGEILRLFAPEEEVLEDLACISTQIFPAV